MIKAASMQWLASKLCILCSDCMAVFQCSAFESIGVQKVGLWFFFLFLESLYCSF